MTDGFRSGADSLPTFAELKRVGDEAMEQAKILSDIAWGLIRDSQRMRREMQNDAEDKQASSWVNDPDTVF